MGIGGPLRTEAEWSDVVGFYRSFSKYEGWEFIEPFRQWLETVATANVATGLYWMISHAHLGFSTSGDWAEWQELPCVWLHPLPGREVEIHLRPGKGPQVEETRRCRLEEATPVLRDFLGELARR